MVFKLNTAEFDTAYKKSYSCIHLDDFFNCHQVECNCPSKNCSQHQTECHIQHEVGCICCTFLFNSCYRNETMNLFTIQICIVALSLQRLHSHSNNDLSSIRCSRLHTPLNERWKMFFLYLCFVALSFCSNTKQKKNKWQKYQLESGPFRCCVVPIRMLQTFRKPNSETKWINFTQKKKKTIEKLNCFVTIRLKDLKKKKTGQCPPISIGLQINHVPWTRYELLYGKLLWNSQAKFLFYNFQLFATNNVTYLRWEHESRTNRYDDWTHRAKHVNSVFNVVVVVGC